MVSTTLRLDQKIWKKAKLKALNKNVSLTTYISSLIEKDNTDAKQGFAPQTKEADTN